VLNKPRHTLTRQPPREHALDQVEQKITPKGESALRLYPKLITADPVIRDAKMCAVEYYPFKPSRSRM